MHQKGDDHAPGHSDRVGRDRQALAKRLSKSTFSTLIEQAMQRFEGSQIDQNESVVATYFGRSGTVHEPNPRDNNTGRCLGDSSQIDTGERARLLN
jgi:hypothetical protein